MPIQYNQTMVTPVQPPAYVCIIAAGDFIQEMHIFLEGAVMVIRMGNVYHKSRKHTLLIPDGEE